MFLVNTAAKATFSGTIDGPANLIKDGEGKLILSGTNVYLGGTEINLGTLQAGASNTFPSSGLVVINDNSILDLNDFSQSIGNLSGSTGTKIRLGAKAATTLTFGDETPQKYDGVISGSGAITKQGSEILTLSGINSYTGGTTITEGTLSITNDLNLGDAKSPITFSNAGGIIQITDSISSTRNIALQAPGSLFINLPHTATLAGVISGEAPFIKDGDGVIVLLGANTYSGGTQIDLGTLQA